MTDARSHKKVICFLFSALCFLNTTIISADPAQNFNLKREKLLQQIEAPLETFTVGESLVFDVSWMGIPIGYGSLETKEKIRVRGREAFHIVATAGTNEFLSKIYPVYDEIHSFIDAERFCSLEFRKNLKEGRYRANERISYDHEAKKATYESFRNQSKKEIDIPSGVHDFISAFFWFRLQPLAVGRTLKTLVNSEAENWDLEIRPIKIVTKEFHGKVIQTVLVEPHTKLKGILYDRGRAWVYFTIDARRLPVWITLQTPFGPVAGVLRMKNVPSN